MGQSRPVPYFAGIFCSISAIHGGSWDTGLLNWIACQVSFGSIASVRQCPPLVRSPTNSNHSRHVQTSLWCDLPVHSKSSNGGVLCVLKPRDIPTRCLPLDDFAEPAVPRFQDSLFPLRLSALLSIRRATPVSPPSAGSTSALRLSSTRTSPSGERNVVRRLDDFVEPSRRENICRPCRASRPLDRQGARVALAPSSPKPRLADIPAFARATYPFEDQIGVQPMASRHSRNRCACRKRLIDNPPSLFDAPGPARRAKQSGLQFRRHLVST